MPKTKNVNIHPHHRKAIKEKLTDSNPMTDAEAIAFLSALFSQPIPDDWDDEVRREDAL